jgi:hypothetical protein
MARDFDQLATTKFQQRMKTAAVAIYQRLFPGCTVQDLREDGVKVHVLDKEFGIDSLLVMQSGQWLSIQEKYRQNKFLVNDRLKVSPPNPDFTQEITNAKGTEHESQGEWFKLGAQLYFYGWANGEQTDFEKWVLIDVARYKLIVEQAGGIETMGKRYQNNAHGRAEFMAFPITRIRDAWIRTYASPDPLVLTTLA